MNTREEPLEKLRKETEELLEKLKDGVTGKLKDEGQIPEFRVKSLSEYCDVVNIITEAWREKIAERQINPEKPAPFYCGELSPWFRGGTDDKYYPDPTLFRFYRKAIYNKQGEGNLYRGGVEALGIKETESYFFKRFKTLGTPFLKREPANNIEWHFLMRHHNLPSRLLDWSKGSFVALYFATKKSLEKLDDSEKKDAAVWMLEPRRLSEMCGGTRSIYGSDEKSLKVIKKYFAEECSHKECPHKNSSEEYKNNGILNLSYPLPIMPDIISPRIQAHIGRFTLHAYQDANAKDFKGGLIKFAKKVCKKDGLSYLVKIVIPHKCHHSIVRSLRSTGITDMNFTQDLDGISGDISLRMHLGRIDHNRIVKKLEREL